MVSVAQLDVLVELVELEVVVEELVVVDEDVVGVVEVELDEDELVLEVVPVEVKRIYPPATTATTMITTITAAATVEIARFCLFGLIRSLLFKAKSATLTIFRYLSFQRKTRNRLGQWDIHNGTTNSTRSHGSK